MPGATSARANGNKTIVTAKNWTGNVQQVEMDIIFHVFLTAWEKYNNGALIQDAFPMLSASDREFILTGTTKKEWDAMFKDPEED